MPYILVYLSHKNIVYNLKDLENSPQLVMLQCFVLFCGHSLVTVYCGIMTYTVDLLKCLEKMLGNYLEQKESE